MAKIHVLSLLRVSPAASCSTTFWVRTTRYKLIRFYGPHNNWELFDLQKDPTEMNNLINDPSYATTIVSLKKELKDLMEHYQDFEALTTWKTTETTIQEMPK